MKKEISLWVVCLITLATAMFMGVAVEYAALESPAFKIAPDTAPMGNFGPYSQVHLPAGLDPKLENVPDEINL